jgi:hypothetical protein
METLIEAVKLAGGFVEDDAHLLLQQLSGTYRGVYSEEGVDKDTMLVKIPFASCFTVAKARSHPVIGAALSSTSDENALGKRVALTFSIALLTYNQM